MTSATHSRGTTQKAAATKPRNFLTFLLMEQFAAKEIGLRIAQARHERGLSQDELADLAAGFGKRSLQDYEAGVTIPYKHLRELSRLLKKPTEWFLYGDPDPPAAVAVEERLDRLESLAERILVEVRARAGRRSA